MNLPKIISQRFLHRKKLQVFIKDVWSFYSWRITGNDEIFQIYGNSCNKEWDHNRLTSSFRECCLTAILSCIPTSNGLEISERSSCWSFRKGRGRGDGVHHNGLYHPVYTEEATVPADLLRFVRFKCVCTFQVLSSKSPY